MMTPHETHVLVETLAWTLIHFLWQGALIAFVLWLLLSAMASHSARARYFARCQALTLMAFAPVLTFLWLWGDVPALPVITSEGGLPLATASGGVSSFWSEPLAWVVCAWCIGAALCVLRFSGGFLQVVRLRRSNVGIDLAPRWQRRFDELARDFGVRARARVIESASVCVPAVIGCVKPVVLLPARLFTGLSDAQIEALFAHELAHIARHDYLVNIAQTIVESLLFYHPAVWWVSRGIRVEREYCCDDLAVAATQNGLAYAHALTALESWRGAQPQLGVSTLGGSLMSRIQRLVGLQPENPRRALRPAHAIAGLFMVGTLGASALAFASLPEPAACDCECACHEAAAKTKVSTSWELGSGAELQLPAKQGTWSLGLTEEELEKQEAAFEVGSTHNQAVANIIISRINSDGEHLFLDTQVLPDATTDRRVLLSYLEALDEDLQGLDSVSEEIHVSVREFPDALEVAHLKEPKVHTSVVRFPAGADGEQGGTILRWSAPFEPGDEASFNEATFEWMSHPETGVRYGLIRGAVPKPLAAQLQQATSAEREARVLRVEAEVIRSEALKAAQDGGAAIKVKGRANLHPGEEGFQIKGVRIIKNGEVGGWRMLKSQAGGTAEDSPVLQGHILQVLAESDEGGTSSSTLQIQPAIKGFIDLNGQAIYVEGEQVVQVESESDVEIGEVQDAYTAVGSSQGDAHRKALEKELQTLRARLDELEKVLAAEATTLKKVRVSLEQ